jgi:hypothetical protein
MSRHPLRRLFAILFAVAFFNATMMQGMSAVAMPAHTDMSMTMAANDGAPPSQPMPCRGMMPSCMIDIGCIFVIGIPAPPPRLVVHLTWAPVSYPWPAVEASDGGARAPDLRPPIRLT